MATVGFAGTQTAGGGGGGGGAPSKVTLTLAPVLFSESGAMVSPASGS